MKLALARVLPGLAQTVVDEILEKMEEMGLESVEDIAEMKDEDLVPPLKIFQARKVVTACKEQGTMINPSPPTSHV